MGGMGLTTLLVFWVGIIALDSWQIEPIVHVSTKTMNQTLLHSFFYTIPVVFLGTLAIALTSALIVNTGMMLCLPLGLVVQFFTTGVVPNAANLIGNVLCTAGFLLLLTE
jgi:hypothetical protein